jgi:alanine-synthesizing transaminase
VWAPIPEEFRSLGSVEFSRRVLEEAAVTLMPGVSFGPEGEGAVRLALVENVQRTQQAVRQIKRAFQKWRKQGLAPADAESPASAQA